MSRNQSPHPNPNQKNQTWGLNVPGRPNTPSEGFAQVRLRTSLEDKADRQPRHINVLVQQEAKRLESLTTVPALPLGPT
jgi:hypothetical protein